MDLANESLLCCIVFRPGSVEVTASLTIRKEDDTPQVKQTLETLNRTGLLDNKPWISIYWGSEGKTSTYKLP